MSPSIDLLDMLLVGLATGWLACTGFVVTWRTFADVVRGDEKRAWR